MSKHLSSNGAHRVDSNMNVLLEHISEAQEGSQSIGRSLDNQPQRSFGRLFNAKPDGQPSREQIKTLAENFMRDDPDDSDGDSDTPIGMAFLGQFIDHDITLDVTTALSDSGRNPASIENFRTPRLELDSVYAAGPEVTPYFYGSDDDVFKLIFGSSGNPKDLPRNRDGRAIIGDPRNDENLVISQIHGRQFIKLHNDLIKQVSDGNPASHSNFEIVRELVRAKYQNRIIEEFLPAVVHADVLGPLISGFNDGQLPGPINWENAPDMPVEFSAAAYRFGHAMIRESYRLRGPCEKEFSLFEIGGFRPVPREANILMKIFFDASAVGVQFSRKINTKLTPSLLDMPRRVGGDDSNLAERNMVRGQLVFNLPSGEEIADSIFPDERIRTHPSIEAVGLENNTPLWFYCLAEAEQFDGKLGPVGGTIVAGTILNLLLRDPMSIARNKARVELIAEFKRTTSTVLS